MSQVVLPVVFHQCVKPADETRRYVAIPRSSVSKISVKPLLDCIQGLPDGRSANSQSGFTVSIVVVAVTVVATIRGVEVVVATVDVVTTAICSGVRCAREFENVIIPVPRLLVAITADALSLLVVGFS